MIRLLLIILAFLAAGLLGVSTASAQLFDSGHSAEILVDETMFSVNGEQGRLTRRQVVLINGPEGRERHGVLRLHYNSFISIRNLSGQILDEDGTRIKRLRRADVRDHAATSRISLYDDARVRIAELYHDVYPYQIEWEYELDISSLLNWPSWYPQNTRDPVRQATLQVDVASGTQLRYNQQWLDLEPHVTEHRGRTIYRWTTAMPPQPQEPLGPPLWTQLAAIHLAGDRFNVEGYAGSLATWTDFGHWYSSVWNGHWDLPEDARAAVNRLVEGVEDSRERARLVYQFVQGRTRYISVQLGIGGWQPFDAAYVHERRYGDCKALTNYLQALLREVGIESYPALIGHGRPDLDPDFPANRFNHVILFVPVGQGDPVWLEATSQHLPFGHLGAGSEGRYALVITPQGGQLMRTPLSSPEMNREERTVAATLAPNGDLSLQVSTFYDGHAIASLRSLLAEAPAQYVERFWREKFDLPRVTVHHTNQDGLDVTAERLALSLDLSVSAYAQPAGRRLLLNPNLTNRITRVPPMVQDRRQPVEAFRYAFVDVDSVRIALPEGYRLEFPLEEVSIDAGFGSYYGSAVMEGGDLVYVRRMSINEPHLPAEAYNDLRDFLQAVARADDRSVSIVSVE